MSVALVTGAAGLVGSETTLALLAAGWEVIGIDNDTRAELFGPDASTAPVRRMLAGLAHYRHLDADICDRAAVDGVFRAHAKAIELVVHAAAQPSHDWSAQDPRRDFEINALGTLNLLEAVREHSPDAVFVMLSTNKVYGDRPNSLPLQELPTRWELAADHRFHTGITEEMSIDRTTHSPFGASKVAADVLTQEYGRYFGLRTVVFRCGCITGARHAGARLHGFLSYLMRCAATGDPYTVYGYQGKQVRDNIDARDLARAIQAVAAAPVPGAVYNMGGGRDSNCSLLEARLECEEISGRPMNWTYDARARTGDHIWWISGDQRFKADYPHWALRHGWRSVLREIHDANLTQWRAAAPTAGTG
ncbi:NAD-dependent epimerase/dehydratase family protein [Streptacidiphilus sp. P02-A3a]|uniref:NAD-dependent epimerase/dehydratase family protein n=1 Tax=Streptacidiphilus sp. P02-A3a TaxID=2704468 RepID=UPI0015FCD76C|nr:NAD-dependent epimerase/dehydratase family protein [Streptacidiphilus sp. P02-A3a]QMU69781.1 NAD-dependent epimerase/dehydratase family protein [Streptacidiphilus sp. P02-A3a]